VRRRTPTILATVALAAVAALAGAAVLGLPGPGRPHGEGQRAAEILARDRSVANAVNGITYDLRATDTFGEELIMLVAAVGVATLLRTSRPDRRSDEDDPAAEDRRRRTPIAGSLRVAGALLVGPVLVVGAYVVTHGALTPGGGFQGGVVLAAALLLVYAAGQAFAVERVHPVSAVEVVEAVGALAFALVGVAGLVAAGSLLANVIGLAPMGSLLSGGTIPVLSVATGVEVAGALALILTEFLDQTLVRTSS
jgi:multicomponent Na+:H+ antiporter subunit B